MKLKFEKIRENCGIGTTLHEQLMSYDIHTFIPQENYISFFFGIEKTIKKTIIKIIRIECLSDNSVHFVIDHKYIDEQDLNIIADKLVAFALVMKRHGYLL